MDKTRRSMNKRRVAVLKKMEITSNIELSHQVMAFKQ
jgi:hypothetical protein